MSNETVKMRADFVQAELESLRARLRREREAIQKVRDEMSGWRTKSAPGVPLSQMGIIYYSRVDAWLAALDAILRGEGTT